ncbi:PucR family transcriptional regulator [Streptomyces iconiensis]|uniref:Helix-turn-helix domain-containing protein n=1 Tax=Streptomyces iconiensis TaxID=1384038 RepID=A0ABT6ZRD1_9ACTN|nr:helix-turn-helix domain-containing protein [Streptomyces iconiensis]MDJ1131334.1 helix-turn-helix domain-containing protein [Streptomyces iconiensis]
MNGSPAPSPGGPALTVAELVERGPLPGVRMYGAAGRTAEVRSVRIVDRLEALDSLRPHTAVVLTGQVAETGWAVEMALRTAWEHAAACVVVADSAAQPVSAGALADRFGLPLLLIDEGGDALDAAVRIASAVAQPDAGRTALLAAAARRVAAAGAHAGRVLGALHEVLPATSVALTSTAGDLLAGRRTALEEEGGGRAGCPVRLEVPGPAGEVLGVLVARTRARTEGWSGTVEEVLRLAVAPLTAWAASRRLADERTGSRSALLLRQLLAAQAGFGEGSGPSQDSHGTARYGTGDGTGAGPCHTDGTGSSGGTGGTGGSTAPEGLLAEVAALGLPVRGPFVVYVLRPVGGRPEPGAGAALRALWARTGMRVPLVAYGERGEHTGDTATAWATWETVPDAHRAGHGDTGYGDTGHGGSGHGDTGEERAKDWGAERLGRALDALGARLPGAGGVAGPVTGMAQLGQALAEADAAAGFAAASGPGTVVRADRMGAARLLSAVPDEELRGPARVVLAPLLAADKDGSLLRTLAVVLDAGAAPTAAAGVLGVHRNTVAARLERIRSLGFDPDDPRQRLALHLACRVLLGAEQG